MPSPRRSSTAAFAFAWCGAALFTLSLIFFAYSYVIRFGAPAPGTELLRPIAVDVVLFTIFALHHSILARPRLKDAVRARVDPALERSIYIWIASLLFVLVCAAWQFVPGVVYTITGPAAWLGYVVQIAGLIVTVRGSARLDVLDLAGVRPLLERDNHAARDHVPLETTGLYGFVRHPLYFGWLLVVFGAPHMTATRFVFAATSTLYLVLAIPLEERSLIQVFGSSYRDYQKQVRWRMLPGVY